MLLQAMAYLSVLTWTIGRGVVTSPDGLRAENICRHRRNSSWRDGQQCRPHGKSRMKRSTKKTCQEKRQIKKSVLWSFKAVAISKFHLILMKLHSIFLFYIVGSNFVFKCQINLSMSGFSSYVDWLEARDKNYPKTARQRIIMNLSLFA